MFFLKKEASSPLWTYLKRHSYRKGEKRRGNFKEEKMKMSELNLEERRGDGRVIVSTDKCPGPMPTEMILKVGDECSIFSPVKVRGLAVGDYELFYDCGGFNDHYSLPEDVARRFREENPTDYYKSLLECLQAAEAGRKQVSQSALGKLDNEIAWKCNQIILQIRSHRITGLDEVVFGVREVLGKVQGRMDEWKHFVEAYLKLVEHWDSSSELFRYAAGKGWVKSAHLGIKFIFQAVVEVVPGWSIVATSISDQDYYPGCPVLPIKKAGRFFCLDNHGTQWGEGLSEDTGYAEEGEEAPSGSYVWNFVQNSNNYHYDWIYPCPFDREPFMMTGSLGLLAPRGSVVMSLDTWRDYERAEARRLAVEAKFDIKQCPYCGSPWQVYDGYECTVCKRLVSYDWPHKPYWGSVGGRIISLVEEFLPQKNITFKDLIGEKAAPLLTFHELLVLQDVEIHPRCLYLLSIQEVISCVRKLERERVDCWLKYDQDSKGLQGLIKKISSLAENKTKNFVEAIEDYHAAATSAGLKDNLRRITLTERGIYFFSSKEGLRFAPKPEARIFPAKIKDGINGPFPYLYPNSASAARALEMWREHFYAQSSSVPPNLTIGVKDGVERGGGCQVEALYFDKEKGAVMVVRNFLRDRSIEEGDRDYPSPEVLERLHLWPGRSKKRRLG